MFDGQAILDNLSDGVYTVSRDRRITYWNKAATAITGYHSREVEGLGCHDGPLKHVDGEGNDLCARGCPLLWAMLHNQQCEADAFLHHKEGHRIPVRVKIAPLCAPDHQVIGAVELFADNTEQMLALERIAELEQSSLLDPLTHLANKTYLENQAQRYLREMVRHPMHVGVLVIEIDHFDELCRTFPVAARNRLLQVVAETIRSNCRPFDLFGHVDDGCFVGLLHDVTSNQLYVVARKLHVLIESSHFFTGEQIVRVVVTVGGTMLRMEDSFQSAVARCENQLATARHEREDQHIAVFFDE